MNHHPLLAGIVLLCAATAAAVPAPTSTQAAAATGSALLPAPGPGTAALAGTLTITGATSGGTATATITGANPGTQVCLGYSLAGPGPTNVTPGTCQTLTVNLSNPITTIGCTAANAGGTAVFTTNVPANTTGLNVWVQAVCMNVPGTPCTPTNSVLVTL